MSTEPPWHKPLVVNGVVVGPFEEEEEGTGVTSDVVKVEGEDPTRRVCGAVSPDLTLRVHGRAFDLSVKTCMRSFQ